MSNPHFSRGYAIDAATGYIKRALGQAAVTSDAYIGTQIDQGAAVMTDFALVLNVEAVDVAGGDELYTFRAVGSNVADRSDGEILGTLELGDAAALPIDTVDVVAGGQYILHFRSEKNGKAFRYIDLHLDGAGASFSIAFGAYITKQVN